MSIDQRLREQLLADAESVTPPDAVRRLQAVRALARARRRRRTVAVVAATVAVVGVIIGVSAVQNLVSGPDPVDNPERSLFPKTLDGDKLIDSTELDGKKWTSLTFDADDLKFQWALECNVAVIVDVEIRGYIMSWSQRCRPHTLGERPMRGQVGSEFSPEYLAERMGRDLDPDQPVTIRARVTKVEKEPAEGNGVTVGLGAYDMTGARTTIGDVGLPDVKNVDGRSYRLADYVTKPTSDQERSLSLDIPAADTPGLLVHGTPTMGWNNYEIDAPRQLGVRGSTGSGFRTDHLRAQPASTVTMTMHPHDRYDGSPGVLAYYRAVDAPDTDGPDISFPSTTSGRDPLVASDVGEPGQSVFRSTFTPTDSNLAFANACALPDRGGNSVQVVVSVNGHRITSGGCSAYDGEVSFGDLPARNRTVWAHYGVEPGKPAEVVIRARPEKGSGVSLEGIRLGFAAYERSAPRTEAGGFVLDDCQRWRGRWYELADYDTVTVTDRHREAKLSVPDVDDNLLLGSGTRGGDGGLIHTLVGGRTVGTWAPGPDGFGFQRIGGDTDEVVAMRASRNVNGGHLMIAYYTPEP